MSWPSDGQPRFVVTRTDGSLEMPVGAPGGRNLRLGQQATFAVLDRASCHREVARFRSEDWGGIYRRTSGVAAAEFRANARCDELNGLGPSAALPPTHSQFAPAKDSVEVSYIGFWLTVTETEVRIATPDGHPVAVVSSMRLARNWCREQRKAAKRAA